MQVVLALNMQIYTSSPPLPQPLYHKYHHHEYHMNHVFVTNLNGMDVIWSDFHCEHEMAAATKKNDNDKQQEHFTCYPALPSPRMLAMALLFPLTNASFTYTSHVMRRSLGSGDEPGFMTLGFSAEGFRM